MGQEELENKVEKFKEKIISLRDDFAKEVGKYIGIEFITLEEVKFEPCENMDKEYIVVGYNQEVYEKTFRCEDEIVDILDEGSVSAVLRLKNGKLEYASIEWPANIENDAEIIWRELLMRGRK